MTHSIGALKNGSRLNRIVLGDLPKPLMRTKRWVRSFRVMLENATVERYGDVSVVNACLINSATVHEQAAAVIRWLLLHRFGEMTTADVVKALDSFARHTSNRNREVERLQLDRAKENDILSLYSVVPLPEPSDNGSDPTEDSDNTLALDEKDNGQT